MKSISTLIAALVLLAIVIGVGVGVALLSGALTQRLQPTGASLNIQSVRVQALTGDKRYMLVEVTATVTGAQSVRIDRVGLYWESSGLRYKEGDPWEPSKNKYFTPGSTINIIAKLDLGRDPKPKDYAPVRVVIKFCDTTGTCYRVSGSTVLEPYVP